MSTGDSLHKAVGKVKKAIKHIRRPKLPVSDIVATEQAALQVKMRLFSTAMLSSDEKQARYTDWRKENIEDGQQEQIDEFYTHYTGYGVKDELLERLDQSSRDSGEAS